MQPELFLGLILLPIGIFLARVCDVSLGTLRIIFISRGYNLAALIGFFEIMIWLLAISQVMQNLTNWTYYVAYAGGYATGTYVGIHIEKKLSIGLVLIRVITRTDATRLVKLLRESGYGVTVVDAQGNEGPVKIIFTIINRKDLRRVMGWVKKLNPLAFYSIEDVRSVREVGFPRSHHHYHLLDIPHTMRVRKGK